MKIYELNISPYTLLCAIYCITRMFGSKYIVWRLWPIVSKQPIFLAYKCNLMAKIYPYADFFAGLANSPKFIPPSIPAIEDMAAIIVTNMSIN